MEEKKSKPNWIIIALIALEVLTILAFVWAFQGYSKYKGAYDNCRGSMGNVCDSTNNLIVLLNSQNYILSQTYNQTFEEFPMINCSVFKND